MLVGTGAAPAIDADVALLQRALGDLGFRSEVVPPVT